MCSVEYYFCDVVGDSFVVVSISVLIDFSLTVKAATLIFIYGRGSEISSVKQGKSESICNLVKNYNKLFEPRKRACIS